MSGAARVMSSEYMRWAKTRSHARFNLTTSGMLHYPLAGLPVTLADLEISGPSFYGYEPLQRALAERYGVAPANVVAANGTSMANHLAMAALLAPGDEALIEHPTYELLVQAARYLGATVRQFTRRFEDGFRLDVAEIERHLTPRTRLIVVTNLHNPSSVLTDDDTLRQAGALARRVGARVLVDEVYLEAAFEDAPRSAYHLAPEVFVVTSSLTKVYGLSGLRCGWVLADAALAERLWRLNDLFGVIPAHAAERLSVIALQHLDRVAQRTRRLLDANRALLNQFLDAREDLEAVRTPYGTTAFPRLRTGSVEDLCARLREKYETTVVPGRFFGMTAHFRVGLGGETETLAGGLERLGAALDEAAQ